MSIAKNINIIAAVKHLMEARDEELVDSFVNDDGTTWVVIRRDITDRLVFARVDAADVDDDIAPLVRRQFEMAAMSWLTDNDLNGDVQVSFDHIILYILNEHRAFVKWVQNVEFKEEN